MAVGAARLLDARLELAAVRVRMAGVAAAHVARQVKARQDHLVLPPALLQERADGRHLRLQPGVRPMTCRAGRREVATLERIRLVHRDRIEDYRLERVQVVAGIARARRRAELAEVGVDVAVAAAGELESFEHRWHAAEGAMTALARDGRVRSTERVARLLVERALACHALH